VAENNDDMHERVSEMADRLGLKGQERRKYVHEHMTRGGYRMEPTYVPADGDDDDDDGGGFFDSRSRRRSSRDDDDGRSSRRRSTSSRRSRDDDWY
jgi:hypothetical protein